MVVRISEATTCFDCGIKTPYEVKEIKQVTSLLSMKLGYLAKFKNCHTLSYEKWCRNHEGNKCLIVYATPLINGKWQGCTSIWFEIIRN